MSDVKIRMMKLTKKKPVNCGRKFRAYKICL